MSKPNILFLLCYFLPYANMDDIPDTVTLPIPYEQCGIYIGHYLLGTIWEKTTPAKIRYAWEKHYASQYTWEQFQAKTANWLPSERCTDCNGMVDAVFRYLWNGGDGKFDINADTNYREYCTDTGLITDRKKLALGTAVFKDSNGRKTHIGYICGFDGDEPLVLEAQSFLRGIRVNYLKDRPAFTYKGLMTKLFDYTKEDEAVVHYPDEPVIFELTSPMMKGDEVRLLQQMLNDFGYKGDSGEPLVEDGKCGRKTIEALTAFVAEHAFLINPDVSNDTVTDTIRVTVGDDIIFEGVVIPNAD